MQPMAQAMGKRTAHPTSPIGAKDPDLSARPPTILGTGN